MYFTVFYLASHKKHVSRSKLCVLKIVLRPLVAHPTVTNLAKTVYNFSPLLVAAARLLMVNSQVQNGFELLPARSPSGVRILRPHLKLVVFRM